MERIDVESCHQMHAAATELWPRQDAAVLCAAVADFKPETQAPSKIKRKGDSLTLTLKPTEDIAAALGATKQQGQKLVGFALETDNEEINAKGKLEKKNLDFIVMNSTRNEGTTFGTDDNKIAVISRSGRKDYDKKPKRDVARDIVDEMERLFEEE